MNQQAKAAWASELRSGNWKQIASGLCDEGNGRCVLGCLCEAYRKAFGNGYFEKAVMQMPADESESSFPSPCYRFKGEGTPPKVWAGLTEDKSRLIRYEGEMMDVSELNKIGVPFAVLADLIEAQL